MCIRLNYLLPLATILSQCEQQQQAKSLRAASTTSTINIPTITTSTLPSCPTAISVLNSGFESSVGIGVIPWTSSIYGTFMTIMSLNVLPKSKANALRYYSLNPIVLTATSQTLTVCPGVAYKFSAWTRGLYSSSLYIATFTINETQITITNVAVGSIYVEPTGAFTPTGSSVVLNISLSCTGPRITAYYLDDMSVVPA
ncbi:uncharacterized protein BP5553_08897 [Venustampulla echinocandica]|uniref:CBM-cenC domain-containing protein n=1 Tax=Venustampulla echinocandica TaxID=2656787 RepID=A0A370TDE0_9HELO|nr:uncharacterized protein BP5553_08897 [Venustampulla echinocandica]RDL32441.1 hypothetical protein BP5553_08897 [Venustampulla echinocandica]